MQRLPSASYAALCPEGFSPSLRGHLAIMRVDHWFKNAFVAPGIFIALTMSSTPMSRGLFLHIAFGLASVCLVASSNYVLNELMDASFDRHHPTKCRRPVPSGEVHIALAYAQWFTLMLLGLGVGLLVSIPFLLTMVALWIMGCIYNIPPIRSKDLPYVDVLSEAVNNPLRMLAGWFMVGSGVVPPASLVLSYWMIGCYFMAMKRFAEYRSIGDSSRAAAYRKSFSFYGEDRLLVSIMFYGSAAMLFFGAFIVRYRMELILSFPFIAIVMAFYLELGLHQDSPVQQPEKLYRETSLIYVIMICIVIIGLCLIFDIPFLYKVFFYSLHQ